MTKKVIIPNNAFFDELQTYLAQGKPVWFNVKGGSMRPFLLEGDRVMIQRCMPDELKAGDVILARWRQKYVLHRLVKFGKEGIGLAGDANLSQIEWIANEDILAKVQRAQRGSQTLWQASDRKQRLLGLCWYGMRPLRRVLAKLKK